VQFVKLQKPCDLDVDLGLSQGHINMHNTYRTTIMAEHVTVATCSMEIWPFEFREVSTFGEVIAFVEGN